MSHGLYDRCECGHLHPEHSLSGVCRGCTDCPDDSYGAADLGAYRGDEEEHVYQQCACRGFILFVLEIA